MKSRIFSLHPPVLACVLLLPAAFLRARDPVPDLLRDPAWTPEITGEGALAPPIPNEAPWAAEPFAQGPSEHRLEELRDKALLVKPDALEEGDGEANTAEPEEETGVGSSGPGHVRPIEIQVPFRRFGDLHPGDFFPGDPVSGEKPREEAPASNANPETAGHRPGLGLRHGRDRRVKELPQSEKTASQLYLDGHLAMKDGRALEEAGDNDAAFKCYSQARDSFDAAQHRDPEWQKEIVAFRRAKIRKDLQRVAQISGHAALEEEPVPEKHADPESQIDKARRPDHRPPLKAPPPPRHEPPQALDPFASSYPPAEESQEILLQRLSHLENALKESRQREASLRAVLRDLLNDPSARQADPRRKNRKTPAEPGPTPPDFPSPPPTPRFFNPGEPVPLPEPFPPAPPEALPAPLPPNPDSGPRP